MMETMNRTEVPETKPGRSRRWTRVLRTVVLLLVAVGAGLLVAQVAVRSFRPHAYAGTVFPSAPPAAALDGLTLSSGDPANLDDFAGDVVLMYFGYTHCPDVCPTTLSVAAEAIDGLGDDGEQVQLLMISVDPARDPLGDLGAYVQHFHPDFLGAGGDEDAIADVASLYGIYYELHEPDDTGNYVVDHTATLMGIDPDGNLKVLWDPSVTPDDLEADLKELIK